MKILFIISALVLAVGGGISLYVSKNDDTNTYVYPLEVTLSAADMAKRADVIVQGKIIQQNAELQNDPEIGELVVTKLTIETTELLKGTPPVPFIVTIIGGEYKGKTTRVSDYDVQFKTGDEYLLYLSQVSEKGIWVPLSVRQTMFRKANGKYLNPENKEVTVDSIKAEISNLTVSQ